MKTEKLILQKICYDSEKDEKVTTELKEINPEHVKQLWELINNYYLKQVKSR